MLGFSLYSEQNLQRVKYLARLSNMDMHRWPKLMLNAVMNVNCDIDMIRYKWFSSVNNVLNKCNMGYVMKSGIQTDSNWANTFKHIHKIVCHDVWSNTVQEKTSLSDYLQFKDVVKLEEYLLDYTDFYGCSLKFKARSNTLPLDYRTRHWSGNSDGICSMCKDSNEDLRHFLFTCMSLNEIRTDEYLKVEMDLCNNGFSDVWISFITSNLDMKLYIMLWLSPQHHHTI